jgi:hypothetical protein
VNPQDLVTALVATNKASDDLTAQGVHPDAILVALGKTAADLFRAMRDEDRAEALVLWADGVIDAAWIGKDA